MVKARRNKKSLTSKQKAESDVEVNLTAESDTESSNSDNVGDVSKYVKKNDATKRKGKKKPDDQKKEIDEISQNTNGDLKKAKSRVRSANHNILNDNLKCKVCSDVITDNRKAIICEGKCGQWHHTECVGISVPQYKMIHDLGSVIVWLCVDDKKCITHNTCNNTKLSCSQANANLVIKEDIVNCENKILGEIKKLKEIVNSIDRNNQKSSEVNPGSSSVSYSNVLKSTPKLDQRPNRSKLPGIIIKPKKVQSAVITKNDVTSKINPSTIKFGMKSLISLSSGSVIVTASTEYENQRFVEDAKIKLADLYEVSRVKLRKPRLFLSGLDKKYDEADLLTELKQVNHFITPEDEIKMVFIKQSKASSKWMTSLEVSSNTFNKMVDRYINIGWKSHYAKEDLHILRCYKCQGYNHNSNMCKNLETCLKCAGSHSAKNCESDEISCCNCIASNIKYKTEFLTTHKADNPDCKVFLSKVNKLRSNIAYSTISSCQ